MDPSSIPGMLYEGEDVKTCPLCSERLMWYWLPDDMEMLACTNPRCVYPFDDTSPYEMRARTHNKTCVRGNPAEPEPEPE